MKKGLSNQSPDFTKFDDEQIRTAYPGGFSTRDEANALAACAFRNGPLEDLHAGKLSPALADPEISRITDAEMKALMINASTVLARLLERREKDAEGYRSFIQRYGWMYCKKWERG